MDAASFRIVAAQELHAMLGSESPPLVLDTRATGQFATLHIAGAISLSLPLILLKRIMKSPQSVQNLDDLVVCDKASLGRRRTGCPVVLCDETGLLDSPTSTTILSVLATEGIVPAYLDGGVSSFVSQYPEHCSSNSPAATLTPILPASPSVAVVARRSSSEPFDAEASRILDFMFMSNERDAHSVDFIRAFGITHVLNLTPTPPDPDVQRIAACTSIPLIDTTNQDIIEVLPVAIAFIEEARTSNGRVLVHCFAGVSRSAAVTIAYFMQFFSLSLEAAYARVKEKRPCISPNLNFMGQLQKWEEIVRGSADARTPQAETVREGDCV